MKIDDLKLTFGFMGESIFGDFHEFIAQNGYHSFNEFIHNTRFKIYDSACNQLLINDSTYLMNFEDENKPFKLQHFKDECILKFISEGTIFYKMEDILNQYWAYFKDVECKIEIFTYSQPEKDQEEISPDLFWRPKRIEIFNYG